VGEKRMLIVPVELIKKIDDNRGDMGQAEFVEFLIDSQFKKEPKKENNYITKEEFQSFEQDTKKLLRSFLDFFVSYGLELGKQSPKNEFEELTSKLHELESDFDAETEARKGTIKWK
jgi:hypothetical protein